jgi:hypothetical protein
MALINSSFHTQNNFSKNWPQFERASALSSVENLNNVDFKGRQINLPDAPKCPGPTVWIRELLRGMRVRT